MNLPSLRPADINYLVVHCSATPPNQDIGVKEIDRMHRERGFLKIGYHYVIRRNGVIEKGRADNEVGAHVEGYNKHSLGICMVGGVEADTEVRKDSSGSVTSFTPADNFTLDQYHALAILLSQLKAKYTWAKILGHRDFPGVAKACPSFDVKSWLEEAAPNLL